MAANSVHLVEVGPRDGLQNEAQFVPTDVKIAWINLLSATGLQTIEATSFVSPKWVPQMADHAQVLRSIERKAGIHYPVLIPNVQGLEQALLCGVQDIAVFVSASESFAQKNTHCSIEHSFERLAAIMRLARQHALHVRGYVSCIVHCPYEGLVTPSQVYAVSQRLLDAGCFEVSLGDTTGKATPQDIQCLLDLLCARLPSERLAGHFHDTDGHALANIAVAFNEYGIRTFDSSLNGLGGCPYAPGAKGNVATESVVAYFDQQGVDTGIDAAALSVAQAFIQQHLSGK